jgi:hypothetical protein
MKGEKHSSDAAGQIKAMHPLHVDDLGLAAGSLSRDLTAAGDYNK